MTQYHFNPTTSELHFFDTVFLLLFNWFGVSTCIWTEAGSRSMWPEVFQHIRASAKVHHPLETVTPRGLAPIGEIIVHLLSHTSQYQTIKIQNSGKREEPAECDLWPMNMCLNCQVYREHWWHCEAWSYWTVDLKTWQRCMQSINNLIQSNIWSREDINFPVQLSELWRNYY